MTPALQVRFFINSSSLILLITLVSSLWAVKAEAAASANCLVPPAFDPGVGELYFCSPQEGERHLIEYARQSYVKEELISGAFTRPLHLFVGYSLDPNYQLVG